MVDNSNNEYFVVGIHGPPTRETAPHGAMYRFQHGDGTHTRWYYGEPDQNRPATQWAPLPAPPTEQAPAPEPEPRWGLTIIQGRPLIDYTVLTGHLDFSAAHEGVDALNALDRDGVAWGEPRPMDALRGDEGMVILTDGRGSRWVRDAAWVIQNRSSSHAGFWPLPPRAES